MKPTIQRRPRKAEHVIWDGTNTDEIAAMIDVEPFRDCLTVRHNGTVSHLAIGDVVYRQENGVVVCCTQEELWRKYEQL